MSSAIAGKRVLVTRPKEKGGKLIKRLEALGAIPLHMPVTEILEPRDMGLLDGALTRLNEFDWLVFTSANGVEAVTARLTHLQISLSSFVNLKVAVVGSATAEALRQFGHKPDAMPERFVGAEIAKVIPNLPNSRIMLARGDLASGILPEALASQGAVVVDVIAYRMAPRIGTSELDKQLRPDAITVMSGESARATIEQLRACGLDDWLQTVPIACIGPVTAATVEDQRIHPAAVADEQTVEGLVQTLERLFSREAVHA